MIEHTATLGILHEAVLLIARLDGVEQSLLGCIIARAVLLGALEHQVLQVVGQTGGLGGVITRAGAHCDMSRDARTLVVNTQEYLQAIAQRVALRSHRVTWDRCCCGLLCCHAQECKGGKQCQKKLFHFVLVIVG